MKKKAICLLAFLLLFATFTSCAQQEQRILKIFNWGQYIDMDVIAEFETLHNIKIIYDTFDSNEAMYNKLASGAVSYDLVFPSDYMAEKMIAEDMLTPLDFTQIPNIQHINNDLLHRPFDPNQTFTVPYFWGTVGIIYDKTRVRAPVNSWDILWDEAYRNEIFMYNSSRDAMMVALKKLGYSMNTTNLQEINAAKDQLLAEKPLVLGYVGDEVINAMINNQATLAVGYSGDATAIIDENENMAYAIPQQGTNIWIDTVVMPKTATEQMLALAFINYLADPEVAKLNTELVGYSTPNTTTLQLMEAADEPWTDWQSYNPDLARYEHLEFFHADDAALILYNNAWEEVLNA
jgi:spermidine/putrescine transport system substrate-binding protein